MGMEISVSFVSPDGAVWSLGEGRDPDELDKPIDTPPLSTLLTEKPQGGTIPVGEWQHRGICGSIAIRWWTAQILSVLVLVLMSFEAALVIKEAQVPQWKALLLMQLDLWPKQLIGYFELCVQRGRHQLRGEGGVQRSPPQTHHQVVQRKMDGSGQQNREALAAERDLWPSHQGTLEQGSDTHNLPAPHDMQMIPTNHPPLTDPHIWDAHHQGQRELCRELQVRGHLQGQVWQLFLWPGNSRFVRVIMFVIFIFINIGRNRL